MTVLAPDSAAARALTPWIEAMATGPRPETAMGWLHRHQRLIAGIGTGHTPLSHQGLDLAGGGRDIEWLRHQLIETGVLATRDGAIAAFARWLHRYTQPMPQAHRLLLREYGTWRLIPGLRKQARRRPLTPSSDALARSRVKAGGAFLRGLEANGVALPDATQADLDDFMVNHPALRSGLGPFIEWARRSRRCTPLILPRLRKTWAGTHMDQNERWTVAERLLTDTDLDLQTRVAGLFILLYGQPLSRVLALRLPEHLTIEADLDTNVSRIDVLFGDRPVRLPAALAELVSRLAQRRHHERASIAVAASPWLFVGIKPGEHTSATSIQVRLRKLGCHPGPARSAALIHLSQRVDPPVLAPTLGMSRATATKWQEQVGKTFGVYIAAAGRTVGGTE